MQFGAHTILIPGHAESGKSTLTAGLVRAGFDYLSDELAVLDPASGRVEPYQRPISIDPGAYDLFHELTSQGYETTAEQWHVDPLDLRGYCLGRTAAATHLIFNRFEAGARTELVPVRAAEALHLLVENSVHLADHGAWGFRLLSELAETCSGFRMVSGDLEDQIEAVRSLVA